MYPTLTVLVIIILAFALVYTLFKGSRQAKVSHEERTDNPVGAMTWLYVIGAVIVLGGIFIYAFLRYYT